MGKLRRLGGRSYADSPMFTESSRVQHPSLTLSTLSRGRIHRAQLTYIFLSTMSAAGGTFRGTPNRGGHGRGQVPAFENSPSNIPRPKLESHASSAMQSETGTSTLSASRQKQTKRDEVGHSSLFIW